MTSITMSSLIFLVWLLSITRIMFSFFRNPCPRNFQIFPEVKKLYDDRAAELRDLCNKKYEAYYEWKQANPLAANEYETFMSGETPCIDWSLIQQKAGA